MLHEILLSLSGIQSPIWDRLDGQDDLSEGSTILAYTSPAEKVMLGTLKHLADLHIQVRTATNECSRSNPSPACRATSARIRSKHLKAFTSKIIAVESSILCEDSQYVGAYKAVSLSTIVTEFEPWKRLLSWMLKIMTNVESSDCNTAKLINLLDAESHTGYNDVLRLALDLLQVAQEAWIQTLMPWILYGQLPPFGKDDFMIEKKEDDEARFVLRAQCVPNYVPTSASNDILAIGEALDQLNSKTIDQASTKIRNAVLPYSLGLLQAIVFPLSSHALEEMVRNINDRISDVALSQLLSIEVIDEFLSVTKQFVLLQDGEFSATLIREADKAVSTHQSQTLIISKPVRKAGRLDGLVLSEHEISAILDHTWSELLLQASEEKIDDKLRARATSWLRLENTSKQLPISTILPVPACISIRLSKDSGLNMFIKKVDITRYQQVNSYLLSLHRAQAQLHKLWQMPLCRRTAIPRPSRYEPKSNVESQRVQQDLRQKSLRSSWACASQCLFFLSELHNHIHGEILHNSWSQFHSWLRNGAQSRPSTSGRSRPGTSSDQNGSTSDSWRINARNQDPRVIAQAHHHFLKTLHECLLLGSETFISALRDLLMMIDHFVALFVRLHTIWQATKLNNDRSPAALSDTAKEESDILKQLKKTNGSMTEMIHELVTAIRDISSERDMQDMSSGISDMGFHAMNRSDFTPWKARTLDRLLMKLDSLSGVDRNDHYEDALLNVNQE